MNTKTILVPVDFGDATAAALAEAKELARGIGAEIRLFNVVGLPVPMFPGVGVGMPPELMSTLLAAAKEALEALAKEHQVVAEPVTMGDAAPEILGAVGNLKPAMVVMGTHGRRGFARLFLGSVAESVVRESPVPVVTVRPAVSSASQPRGKRTILVPVDFEEHAPFDLALSLAAPLQAEVVLMHAYRAPFVGYPEAGSEVGARLYEEVASAAKRALTEMAAKAGNLATVLREGEAAARIAETIEELHPVLVVMGTHGRRGVRRLLLGSVAERVVRTSKVPVLTTRTPEA